MVGRGEPASRHDRTPPHGSGFNPDGFQLMMPAAGILALFFARPCNTRSCALKFLLKSNVARNYPFWGSFGT